MNDPQRVILCMKWGTKYGPEYVNRLYAMVRPLRRRQRGRHDEVAGENLTAPPVAS